MKAPVGAVAIVALCAGCGAHVMYVRHETSYRLALDRGTARDCYASCAPRRHEDAQLYAECLAQCPDTRVQADHVCSPEDVPPIAECVDVPSYERRRTFQPLPPTVAATLGFLGGVAVTGLVVAAASGPMQRQ